MAEKQRYSEKRLKDGFTAMLLLRAPLSFRLGELVAAIEAEFPRLGKWQSLMGDRAIRTDDVVTMAPLAPLDGGGWVNLIGSKVERAPLDHYRSAVSRARGFPGAEAALRDHTHYLSVSANSKDQSLAERYRAARLVTCVAAVLAEDPDCLGVLFPSGDVIASPQAWRAGASEAHDDKWPLAIWTSMELTVFQNTTTNRREVACGAVGMAAFNGHEVCFPSAPVEPLYAAKYVFCAMAIILERGHVFRDSDTIGVENGDERLRIRLLKEGEQAQTDTWVIIHPNSSLNELAMFGDRPLPPAPPGHDNRIFGDDQFMQKLLWKKRAG